MLYTKHLILSIVLVLARLSSLAQIDSSRNHLRCYLGLSEGVSSSVQPVTSNGSIRYYQTPDPSKVNFYSQPGLGTNLNFDMLMPKSNFGFSITGGYNRWTDTNEHFNMFYFMGGWLFSGKVNDLEIDVKMQMGMAFCVTQDRTKFGIINQGYSVVGQDSYSSWATYGNFYTKSVTNTSVIYNISCDIKGPIYKRVYGVLGIGFTYVGFSYSEDTQVSSVYYTDSGHDPLGSWNNTSYYNPQPLTTIEKKYNIFVQAPNLSLGLMYKLGR